MELSQAVNRLQFANNFALPKRDIVITVRIRGESGAAHAAAILTYFGFSSADETAFQRRYSYNLREHLTQFYANNDDRRAHRALGGGVFEVRIPIPANLYEQIKSVKGAANDSADNQNGGANPMTLLQPVRIPENATAAERNFYNEINTLRSALVNFGSRAVQASEVRAEYLKLIKMASDEFVELVQTGKLSPEEGALRASKLRNFILDLSRGKDSELGRAIAESLKKKDYRLIRFCSATPIKNSA